MTEEKIKTKRVRLKVGHIFKCPLSNSKHAYGQFYADTSNGQMIRIFDVITDDEIAPEEIVKHKLMFPPIFVGLSAAIREGVWEIVGFQEIKDFKMPQFKSSLFGPTEKDNVWFLIDGDKEIKLGKELPEKYKKLERAGVWSAYDVNKRIENKGEIPYEAWK